MTAPQAGELHERAGHNGDGDTMRNVRGDLILHTGDCESRCGIDGCAC